MSLLAARGCRRVQTSFHLLISVTEEPLQPPELHPRTAARKSKDRRSLQEKRRKLRFFVEQSVHFDDHE
jgi:hypothetical protein